MEPISVGLWGHPDEGVPFDHKGYDGVYMVSIYHGWVIDAIHVQYRKNGILEWPNLGDGRQGGSPAEFVLDDDEYLTEVTGYYGRLFGMGTINSLIFTSNKNNIYGPYGTRHGTMLEPTEKSTKFHVKGGRIVGFKGTTGPHYLSSIGFYVSSLPHLCNKCGEPVVGSTIRQLGRGRTTSQTTGPFGEKSGQLWDDGVFSGIKKLIIRSGGGLIQSLQIDYDRNGETLSCIHGRQGEIRDQIELNHPMEFLTKITGFYSTSNSNDSIKGIRSLTIWTNEATYGPIGEEIGVFFTSPDTTHVKIVGLFGSSSTNLNSIGFHSISI